MPSFIWDRDTQEAYQNPYEYTAQKQFVAEAKRVLDSIHEELCKFTMTYKRGDVSKEKAIWMLLLDAIDSLIDSLELLNAKRALPGIVWVKGLFQHHDFTLSLQLDKGQVLRDGSIWPCENEHDSDNRMPEISVSVS